MQSLLPRKPTILKLTYTVFFTKRTDVKEIPVQQTPCMRVYLRRGTAGKPGELADPCRGCGIAGADEDRGADLHGVAMLRCLRGLVGHGQRSEGVSLFGVLLGVRVLWGRVALSCCRGTFSSLDSRHRRLIPFYQLLGSWIKLCKGKQETNTRRLDSSQGFTQVHYQESI